MSARYARERKHSALELLEKARHKARDIFDRQVDPPPLPIAYAIVNVLEVLELNID